MNISSLFHWRCPACNERLTVENKQWQCTKLHSFDMAKEGYVNLLLAQHKNSKEPGDNKDMVNARREFLAQDYYLPLVNALADLLHEHILITKLNESGFSLFDAGCGEGYYLANIANKLVSRYTNGSEFKLHASGIDISKPAIQKAAKKSKSLDSGDFHFAVASCFDIPLVDNSQNAIIQIFAPAKDVEISRVLQDQGIWIQVSPASEHLYELKSMVYDKPVKHESETAIPDGFNLLSQQELRFDVPLSKPSDRQNLLMMTPFYWTISETKKQKLLADLQATQAHFNIRILQKEIVEV